MSRVILGTTEFSVFCLSVCRSTYRLTDVSHSSPELRSCRETSGEHACMIVPAYCWPSLGLGNTAGAEILQGDVWDSEIQPELKSCRETSGEHRPAPAAVPRTRSTGWICLRGLDLSPRARSVFASSLCEVKPGTSCWCPVLPPYHRMLFPDRIVPPTLDSLWGSERQPELRSCRETSGKHCNLLLTSCVHDCPAYCWRSLGIGHTAGAEILQGDVSDSEIQPEIPQCCIS